MTSLEEELEHVLGEAAAQMTGGANTPREVGMLLVADVGAAIRAAARTGALMFERRNGTMQRNYDPAFRAAIAAIQRSANLVRVKG